MAGMVTRGKNVQRAHTHTQAQSQAQAQKVREVTRMDSLELIRCLLKVSVNEICFLRGLFPEDCFNGINLQHLEGMHLQTLKTADPEAQRVTKWLDEGIQDAIEKNYLKTMLFGLSVDADGTRLLEEYMFSFSYNQDGKVVLEVGGAVNNTNTPFKSADMESIRYQVCRLIRTLVQICRTLDKVPEERFIFMKLTYYDSTPADYEPPYFRANHKDSYFGRKPFHMSVGGIATAYHAVGVRVKSVLDSTEYDDDEAMISEGHSSCPPSTVTGGSAMKATSRLDPNHHSAVQHPCIKNDKQPSQGMPCTDSQVAPTILDAAPANDTHSNITCDSEADRELGSLKAYCLRRSQVNVTDAMTTFSTIKISQLKRYMEQLVLEGILKKCRKPADTFDVCPSNTEGTSPLQAAQSAVIPVATVADAAATAAQKMPVKGTQSDVARATIALQALKASDQNVPAPARLSSGALCQGSENTCSKPTKSHQGGSRNTPAGAMTGDSQPPIADLFFDSQQSGKNKRKASIVEEPVRQQKKGPKPGSSRGRLSVMSAD